MTPTPNPPAGRAFVSGAARRIGRAVALHLAARGWDVAAHHRGAPEEAAAVQAEIERLGRRCRFLPGRLRRSPQRGAALRGGLRADGAAGSGGEHGVGVSAGSGGIGRYRNSFSSR